MMGGFLSVLSDTDQDQAAADTWWREVPDSSKIEVWKRIQEHHPNDPVMEIPTGVFSASLEDGR
jgi:hypothetical protein